MQQGWLVGTRGWLLQQGCIIACLNLGGDMYMLVFKKLMLFDRLYYFFQNKGEDWEISLYVN